MPKLFMNQGVDVVIGEKNVIQGTIAGIRRGSATKYSILKAGCDKYDDASYINDVEEERISEIGTKNLGKKCLIRLKNLDRFAGYIIREMPDLWIYDTINGRILSGKDAELILL